MRPGRAKGARSVAGEVWLLQVVYLSGGTATEEGGLEGPRVRGGLGVVVGAGGSWR